MKTVVSITSTVVFGLIWLAIYMEIPATEAGGDSGRGVLWFIEGILFGFWILYVEKITWKKLTIE